MFESPRPSSTPLPPLRRNTTRLLAALTCAALLAGCGPGELSRRELLPWVQRPQPGVVVFLVDGLPPRLVEQGCAEGWLPNIAARFRDRGTRVQHCVTCVPSITYAVLTTLTTGTSPPTHGILGNRWFDPEQALFRNYCLIKSYDWVDRDHGVPTLYERLRPGTSATIQTVHRRGATQIIPNWATSGVMWYFENYTAVDKLTATTLDEVILGANLRARWPNLVLFYFPGMDSVGHVYGITSRKFYRGMAHADYQVGRVCAWLERAGLLDSTYLILLSDHGMVDVAPDGHIDLLAALRAAGRNPTDEMRQDGPRAGRRAFYSQFDTVVNAHDGRRASVFLRDAAGWETRPAPAAVEQALADAQPWNLTGIDLAACWAGPDEVVLRAPRGTSRIVQRPPADGLEFAYQPGDDDVLGYLDDPDVAAFVAAGFHDSRAWLAATADQRIPDVVPQLGPLLSHRRSGEVVLFPRPGYSFVVERGGHGGVDRDEMLMTFYVAGPGVPAGGVIEHARAVDFVPTVLDLLNVADRAGLEGVALPVRARPAAQSVETGR